MSATTFKFPSTSNLFVASTDRTSGTSSQFVITKQQNIMSGFFTRLAVTEMVLKWSMPNIVFRGTDSILSVNIVNSPNPPIIVSVGLATGFYTVESALTQLVDDLNLLSAPAVFSIAGNDGNKILSCTLPFTIAETLLASQLSLEIRPVTAPIQNYPIQAPNLTRYEYIDFLCTQLTYQANLKDSSTGTVDRDSLYRWVFAWESPSPLDGLGYPINQGYTPFVARRYLSFPKQIFWDASQPIGQLSFEIVSPNGYILPSTSTSFANINIPPVSQLEFNMTLLISEQ